MTDLFPPVMILNLLLVFLDLTVKLVGQTIYRRVEILVNGFNKNVFAGKVNGDFGFLLQFVYRQKMCIRDRARTGVDLCPSVGCIIARVQEIDA